MIRPALLPLVLLVVAACDDGAGASSASSAGGNTGSTTSGPGSSSSGDPGPNELPCDVRAVVEEHCVACHGSPVTSGAPVSLVTRYDFLADYAGTGESVGARSVTRMKRSTDPMPPLSEPPAPASATDVLSAWVAAGMPAGACGSIAPAPYPTPCASGTFWDRQATPTAEMSPGHACKACHKTDAMTFNYFFMGTVFPSFHEADDCVSPPPAEAKVEILDEDGNVTLTLTPKASGNFSSSAIVAGVPLPFTARLVANGLSRAMVTPQMDGDCNGCHSEQGDEDAPGRLVWPSAP